MLSLKKRLPSGYTRNPFPYTVTISKSGGANAEIGAIFPLIAEVIHQAYGVDMGESAELPSSLAQCIQIIFPTYDGTQTLSDNSEIVLYDALLAATAFAKQNGATTPEDYRDKLQGILCPVCRFHRVGEFL